MKLKTGNKNVTHLLERVFRINRIKNIIDISDSFYVINNEVSSALFDAEIYKVTFCTQKNGEIKTYDLFLSVNELICDLEIDLLKEHLGIHLSGDGSQFEILDYQTDFTIQFDQENSSFIESDEVNNGLLFFKIGINKENFFPK
ncbi:hypothetical protein GKZ90_0012490 [Flavobacterium sp. MC2016-06]|jgi:hypothetical protein|uniref:hypothetical protein n=1 Tax=Flavobacterium sp. MC2016-06 TaxID=2676308 RepID=UPI0012BAF11D|nr:hypothetical protein [Flavobacterium sp. MC2016-06]MBU3860128.1 hypothetical protein [Flavobacterium sp. MC2016-06]